MSNILSKDCFEAWLATRSSKVKHPEQSFQRTLTAHLRGADGRRPFPEKVEEELLRILRSAGISNNGAKANPWNKCFGDNVYNVGARGFSNLGFHEKKRLNNQMEVGEVGLNTHESPFQAHRLKKTASFLSGKSVGTDGSLESLGNPAFYPIDTNIASFVASIPKGVAFSPTAFQNATCPPPATALTFPTNYKFSEDIPPNLFHTGEAGMFMYKTKIVAQQLLSQYAAKALSPKLFALLTPLSLSVGAETMIEFMSPTAYEAHFVPTQPVAKQIYSRKYWYCLEETDKAVEILGRKCKGRHLLETYPQSNELLYIMLTFMPVLHEYGRLWSRLRTIKGDGSTGIFLVYIERTNANINTMYFQEVLDQFQNFKTIPLRLF